jgi:hypothetical protein
MFSRPHPDIIADGQLFDPDLINLPPMEHRPSWLLSHHDETDTDYSGDEDEDITIQAIKVEDTDEVSSKGRIERARGEDLTIPKGDHVGVG